jgi:hypothetical protein
VAPETLPALIAAMPDTSLHASLVPLLGEYGAAASNAVPSLEAIVAGVYPSYWSNRTGIYHHLRSRRAVLSRASPRFLDHYGLHLPDVLAPSAAVVPSLPETPWTTLELRAAAEKALANIEPR